MSDKILVNYPALEDMAQHCIMVADRLDQTASTSQKIAGQMQNGALIGEAGEIYVQALGSFYQKVGKLSAKFREEADDIRKAIGDMKAADSTVAGTF